MDMQTNAAKLADLLRVLANRNRLLILCRLIEGEQTVSQLADSVPDITQSALSQHLALLRAHGILDSQKNKQTITYRIADHRIEQVIAVLKENYCN